MAKDDPQKQDFGEGCVIVIVIVIPSAPQKRDFGEGCDAGWEDCPKYVFNGTAGAQLGANFCCRVFILFQIINLNIFLIVQFTFFSFYPHISSYISPHILLSYLISYLILTGLLH